MIKCKTSFDKEHCLAERVSKLTIEEVRKAVQLHKMKKPCNYKNVAQNFLTAVETSCRPIGYYNKAADYARKNICHYGTILILLPFLSQ